MLEAELANHVDDSNLCSLQYATSLLDTLLFLHYLALLLLELRHRGQPQYLIRSVAEMSLIILLCYVYV